MSEALQDKFRGTLLGAAIGDALGAPYEFGTINKSLTAAYVGEQYDRGVFGTKPGSPTDDSTLTRLHAEALMAMGSVATYRPHYMRRARAWQLSGPPDIGGQTGSALSTWGNGEKWPYEAERAAGNGSLMAVSPVGLVAKNAGEAAALGERFASFTHPAGTAKYCNRQYAGAIWAFSRDIAIPTVMSAARVSRPVGMPTDGPSMGFCLVAAGLAFDAIQRVEDGMTPWDSLVDVIVSNGGDTDTNACIAGALLGSAYGMDAWKNAPDWVLEGVEDREGWFELADQLLVKYTPSPANGLVS